MRRVIRTVCLASVLGSMAACDDGDQNPDVPSADARPDTSMTDAAFAEDMSVDVPDDGTQDARMADAGPLDADVPDVLPSDADTPDAVLRDMELLDGDIPDVERLDAETSDSDVADVEIRDVEIPDVEIPDVEIPDAEIPDSTPPDMMIIVPPDAEVPDLEVPDVEVPDVEVPDVEIPDAEIPDVEVPDLEVPDAACVPVDEACNGLDDDCDGNSDESISPRLCFVEGLGLCGQGTTVCEGGVERCEARVDVPVDEICDSQDNDCDGLVDEALASVEVVVEPAPESVTVVDARWAEGHRITAYIADGTLELRGGAAPSSSPGRIEGGGWSRVIGPIEEAASTAVALVEGTPQAAVAYVTRDGNFVEQVTLQVLDDLAEIPAPLPEGIRLSEGIARGAAPHLIRGHGHWAVTWLDARHGNDEIYFALSDGAGIDHTVRVSAHVSRSARPVVAARPEGYAVIWLDDRDGARRLYFRALDEAGDPYTEELQLTEPLVEEATLVWDGSAYGVLYGVDEGGAAPSLYLLRVNHQGRPLGDPLPVGSGRGPKIAFNGSRYVLTWRGVDGVPRLTRREPGAPFGPPAATLAPAASSVGVALLSSNTDSTVISLTEEGTIERISGNLAGCGGQLGCVPEVFTPQIVCGVGLCRADAEPSRCVDGLVQQCVPGVPSPVEIACDGADEDCNGVVDDPPLLAEAESVLVSFESEPDSPEAAWTGTSVGVGWIDEISGNAEVKFQVFTLEGEPLSPPLSITEHGARSAGLRVVFSGSTFGITWYDNRAGNDDIYFALVSADGDALGEPIAITDGDGRQQTPDLSFDGRHFNVVWRDFRAGEGNEIYLSQIDTGGQLIVDQLPLTASPLSAVSPTVASMSAAEGMGVVWRMGQGGLQDLWFGRYDSAGVAADEPQQITDSGVVLAPDLVWTGTHFGLTWVDRRNATEDVFFQLVSPEGQAIGEPVAVADGPRSALNPQISWLGSHFALIWDEDSGGIFRESWFQLLGADGALIGEPLQISPNSDPSEDPSLIFTGHTLWAVYQDYRLQDPELYGRSGFFGGCEPLEACVSAAAPEQLDGRDNDCDGLIDEQLR
ncbi:MAG: MopE-related protein [Bradymonadia bacterium]